MTEFVVIPADVFRVTVNVVEFIPTEGPKAEARCVAPKAVFRDPDFVTKGDDEIELKRWFATKEGLI